MATKKKVTDLKNGDGFIYEGKRKEVAYLNYGDKNVKVYFKTGGNASFLKDHIVTVVSKDEAKDEDIASRAQDAAAAWNSKNAHDENRPEEIQDAMNLSAPHRPNRNDTSYPNRTGTNSTILSAGTKSSFQARVKELKAKGSLTPKEKIELDVIEDMLKNSL